PLPGPPRGAGGEQRWVTGPLTRGAAAWAPARPRRSARNGRNGWQPGTSRPATSPSAHGNSVSAGTWRGTSWTAAACWASAALLAVRGTPALDPYKPYLRQRQDQGITSIAALLREITALGYPGGYTTLYAWLGLLKLAAPARPPAPPAPAQVTRWILSDPAR